MFGLARSDFWHTGKTPATLRAGDSKQFVSSSTVRSVVIYQRWFVVQTTDLQTEVYDSMNHYHALIHTYIHTHIHSAR